MSDMSRKAKAQRFARLAEAVVALAVIVALAWVVDRITRNAEQRFNEQYFPSTRPALQQ
jgi:flagellar biogenesis protein FliO